VTALREPTLSRPWLVQAAGGGLYALLLGVALAVVSRDLRLLPLSAAALGSMLVAATVVLAWSTAVAAAVASSTAAALIAVGIVHSIALPLLGLALACFAMAGSAAVVSAAHGGRMRAMRDQAQQELTAIARRLMAVQERERGQVSRELHDEVGQSLTAALSYLWLAEHQLPSPSDSVRHPLAEARRLASLTLGHIRGLSQRLRPSVLDDYGLRPSLETYLQSFTARHRIATSLDIRGLPERLPAEVETAIFRISQDALEYLARPGRAKRATVSLNRQGEELVLEVSNDDSDAVATRSDDPDLLTVRDRARAIGGLVSLVPARGMHLVVRLPLPAPLP